MWGLEISVQNRASSAVPDSVGGIKNNRLRWDRNHKVCGAEAAEWKGDINSELRELSVRHRASWHSCQCARICACVWERDSFHMRRRNLKTSSGPWKLVLCAPEAAVRVERRLQLVLESVWQQQSQRRSPSNVAQTVFLNLKFVFSYNFIKSRLIKHTVSQWVEVQF